MYRCLLVAWGWAGWMLQSTMAQSCYHRAGDRGESQFSNSHGREVSRAEAKGMDIDTGLNGGTVGGLGLCHGTPFMWGCVTSEMRY